MPKHEPVTDSIIPKTVEPPIPTRTVSTKPVLKSAPVQAKEEQVPVSEAPAASVQLPPDASAKARQEQAYRQREAALKQREQDLADKLALAEKYSKLESGLKAKDFSAFEAIGADYDAFTEWKLRKSEGEDPAMKPVLELKAEIDALKKSQEESVTKEYEATVAEYKKEISQAIESSEEFSSIKALGQQEAVLQLILDSWEQDNEMLTVEEACKDIEDYLMEEAKRMVALPKLAAEKKATLPPPSRIKTLTNDVQVGATPVSTKPLSQLPDHERYAEARRRALAKREGR